MRVQWLILLLLTCQIFKTLIAPVHLHPKPILKFLWYRAPLGVATPIMLLHH